MVTPSTTDSNVTPTSRTSYGRQSSAQSDMPEGFMQQMISQGRELFSGAYTGVRSQVNANPWYGVGVAAIGFLAIGYWLGGFSAGSKRSSYRTNRNFDVEDIDAAAAEDLTIGRSY